MTKFICEYFNTVFNTVYFLVVFLQSFFDIIPILFTDLHADILVHNNNFFKEFIDWLVDIYADY